jgi:mycoredoxin
MGISQFLFGRPPATPHAEALAQGQDGVAIYWRPGCTFCMLLTSRVRGRADRAAWVNIWKDPEARAYVRSVNDGNETVPTVVINGIAHTNPSPGLVHEALSLAR